MDSYMPGVRGYRPERTISGERFVESISRKTGNIPRLFVRSVCFRRPLTMVSNFNVDEAVGGYEGGQKQAVALKRMEDGRQARTSRLMKIS